MRHSLQSVTLYFQIHCFDFYLVRMSDTGSCGDCDCDCFGNSGDCCDDIGGGSEDAYGATSNDDEIATCIETALDVASIGIDTYEAVPTNTSRKRAENGEADSDSDTCQCITFCALLFSILSVIGKYLYPNIHI